MPKLLQNEQCSICTEKIKSVRYPKFASHHDDWDFRESLSLKYGNVEFNRESWLHNVKFERFLFWGVNALICPYCQLTLDSLNEFHLKKTDS